MTERRMEAEGSPTRPDRLDSWKEIASYLGRGVTTVQRWEQEEGLPVHRLPHAKRGSVFASRRELDDWLTKKAAQPGRSVSRPGDSDRDQVTPPRAGRRALAAAWLVIAVAVTAVGWTLSRGDVGNPASMAGTRPALQVKALMDAPEPERAPSLSPDGAQIVFAWERPEATGVYVRNLPSGESRLLWQYKPGVQGVYITKWSPRGDLIAFNTVEGANIYGLYVISPDGSVVRRLTTMAGIGLCWSPDGRSLGFADRTSLSEPFSIYAVDLETGLRRRITEAPAGAFGDTACAWSRDGGQLAAVRFLTRHESDVIVQTLADGSVRQITRGLGGIDDLEWTPDGTSLVFASASGVHQVIADGSGSPALVASSSGPTGHPAFSRPTSGETATLVFQVERGGMGAWMWRAPTAAGGDQPFSDLGEMQFPALSDDGRRLAFIRDQQVWVADWDGSNARQVTAHGRNEPDRPLTGPRWSADGRRLAFSVPIGGQRDIYLIDADGANSFRLTTEPSIEDNPSWSRDGRWVYFRSDRGGVNQIWKAPSAGGPAVRITEGEGSQALESLDGALAYFVRGTWHPGLWVVAANGGRERLVTDAIADSLWGLTRTGVMFIEGSEFGDPELRHLDVRTGRTLTLRSLPSGVYETLSTAEDGSLAVWTRRRQKSVDILMAAWTR